jgi:hypothetical protein
MLGAKAIDDIGWEVARAHLPAGTVLRVTSHPDEDWDGERILRLLFVLREDGMTEVTGDSAAKSLVDLHDRLEAAGELRRGMIDYATEAELAADEAERGGY